MKKVILALTCLCVFCFPNFSEARKWSPDIYVTGIYLFAPRFIKTTVTNQDGEPVPGETVTLNASYREYFNLVEGQPFNPIEEYPFSYETNEKGQVWFIVLWGHYFLYVQDQEQDFACGVPFMIYDKQFIINQ